MVRSGILRNEVEINEHGIAEWPHICGWQHESPVIFCRVGLLGEGNRAERGAVDQDLKSGAGGESFVVVLIGKL